MRVVFISDTHNQHNSIKIPDGDILIHCGDFSSVGSEKELISFNAFLKKIPHKEKILIPGNHDFLCQNDLYLAKTLLSDCRILVDDLIEIGGLKIYGSPWTPKFGDWAFMKKRWDMPYIWEKMPDEIDILVTHGPPNGVLDLVQSFDTSVSNVGCSYLREKVFKIKPKIHAFGHIHEGYGEREIDGVRFINASICRRDYRPLNSPIVVDI